MRHAAIMVRARLIDRLVRLALVAALTLQLAVPAFADDPAVEITNVRFESMGELIYIYYDLVGIPDKAHRVSLYLRRESEPAFVYRPLNVTGEIGTIVFPATAKRITWEFTKDFPEGLKGADYFFEVEVEAPEGSAAISPLVFIGGGVALIGGIVAIVLAGGGEEAPPPVTPTGFPPPPGRP
jgi:hypothetical protein